MRKHQGRSAPGRSSFSNSLNVLALIAVAVFINLAIPQEALSQISSRATSVPFSSSGSAPQVTHAKLPRAPVQAEMPVPPPIKIFAGLNEPLVATGPVGVQESSDLDTALAAFHDAPAKAGKDGDYDDYGKPLRAFIAAHPDSNWNSALYLNIALGYYHSGYYSKVFPYLEKSWQLGRNAATPQAHMMVDKAVGELAQMHAKLGHKKELQALFADIGKRPIGGPATEMIQGAREGLGAFTYDTKHAYLCGPKALVNVLKVLKASNKQVLIADRALSGPHGYSLSQLAALADKVKLKYTLIHRTPGQPIPVPSVIHWNNNHYAAVTAQQDGFYVVQDPTFLNFSGMALSTKAIDAEGSGYFLVPSTAMAANTKAVWRTVSKNSAEAKTVYGMGFTTNILPWCTWCGANSGAGNGGNDPSPRQVPEGSPFVGMTVATAQLHTVSLHMQDTPVGYAPQVGKTAQYSTLFYNQREYAQPATFSFGNLSSKWLSNWQDYIVDDPVHPEDSVGRTYGAGGGWAYIAAGTDAGGNGLFVTDQNRGETLMRFPYSGTATKYVAFIPDGSSKTYSTFNGATSYPRYVFLTSITDPQGNVTTLNYDSSYRITSITDPMGRSTTFTYGLSSYPLLITQITDAFSRTTQITYDTSQRLNSVTDPVGITSSYTYSTTDPTFVTSLTTPYGTSTFNETPNPNDPAVTNPRSLTLTDPLGYTDYIYFYNPNSAIPNTYPSAQIPTGLNTYNTELQTANLFYWNRHQFAACVAASGCSISSGVPQSENYSYGVNWRWATYSSYLYDLPQDIKQPLEYAKWFTWAGQTGPTSAGTLDKIWSDGRVLDDGTTQLETFAYEQPVANGNMTSRTDPMGRVTTFAYASSTTPGQDYIDLLTVQQKTSSSGYTTIATLGSYTNHEPQTYTGADGQTWNYTYNSVGQLKTVKDPNSNTTTFNYDSTGRLSTIVNANSDTILTNTYDSADRVQTQTDSQGYTLTYAYDNLDRITSITYPDGTTDLYDYTFQSGTYAGTASLELRKYTDRLGRVTTYAYDADRRLTSVTEPTSGTSTRTTSYDYYEDGTLKDIIDANGNDTRWAIDIESRPTSKTYAYGTSSAQTETYTWENTSSRLHSITDALSQVKTFSYAKDNKITGITYTSTVNTTPNVTFAWDTYFPRMTSMTDGLGTTSYSYTAIGTNGALKLSGISGPYGSNGNLSLTYDAIGRLSGRTIAGGNETFGYDAINRLTSHGTPLGSFTIGYLGQTNQVSSQSVTNGSTTVSTNWGYDTNTNDRRLISITNSGVTRSYTIGYGSGPTNVYDIQSITDTAASGHPWSTQSHSYTNDMIDRLLTETVTTPGNSTFAYDNLDNPTTFNTPASGSLSPTFNGLNQISTWGSNTYSFDADGNTLSGDGTRTYKWDAENRLIEIDYVGTSNKSTFAYDAWGHRLVDQETVSGTTTTTRYLWCGSRICQTRDGSDNVLRRDLPEGELNVSSGQKLIYMPDQLGSVRDVLDGTSGSLVQSYDYTPYGAVARSNGSTPTDYQFGGLFAHAASGLLLSTTRAYDPVAPHWLSRDQFREWAGPNLYAYIGANTINGVDPYGIFMMSPQPLPPQVTQQIGRILAPVIEGGDTAGPIGVLMGTLAIIWNTPSYVPLNPDAQEAQRFNGDPNLNQNARTATCEMHHLWPVYLGGAYKQILLPLSPGAHDDLHNNMQIWMHTYSDPFGNTMAFGPGYGGRQIQSIFTIEQMWQALYGFYNFGPGSDFANEFNSQFPNSGCGCGE
jgi:RHS repeat-associated protein